MNNSFACWRGLLSLLVLLCHLFQIFIMQIVGDKFLISEFISFVAHISVSLFFLISGIQISSGTLLNVNKNYNNWSIYIGNRIMSIFPR